MDKTTTNSIKGIAAIVVLANHLTMFSNSEILYFIFENTGQLAVAIFLFASGYGLTISYQLKSKSYLKNFFVNKILYLLIIFLCADTIVTIINNIYFGTGYNILNILKSALKFCYPDGRELWFVAVILFCYLSFYVNIKIFQNSLIWNIVSPGLYIIICIMLERGAWWYNTVFCFTLGEIAAFYKNVTNNTIRKCWIFSGGAFILLEWLYRLGYSQLQFICPILFLLFIYSICFNRTINLRLFIWVNKVTFELYLVHLVILSFRKL